MDPLPVAGSVPVAQRVILQPNPINITKLRESMRPNAWRLCICSLSSSAWDLTQGTPPSRFLNSQNSSVDGFSQTPVVRRETSRNILPSSKRPGQLRGNSLDLYFNCAYQP